METLTTQDPSDFVPNFYVELKSPYPIYGLPGRLPGYIWVVDKVPRNFEAGKLRNTTEMARNIAACLEVLTLQKVQYSLRNDDVLTEFP